MVLDCSTEKFQKLIDRAYENMNMELDRNRKNVHIDITLIDKGIRVEYHDGIYKKKIKFVVNPTELLGGDDAIKLWKPNEDNISRLLYRLEKNIGNYFNFKYNLDSFKLVRIDFAVNIDVKDRENVSAYLWILRNVGRVKGFSPKYSKGDVGTSDSSVFYLEGNSNNIDFVVCDQEAVINRKDAKGVLRIEVRLMKQKAIRKYTDKSSTTKQIEHLTSNCQEIFLETFVHVVPYGDYYKKQDAINIITEKVPKRKTRVKMIKLLELIPKKKSLHLAQKAMNDRNIDMIMKSFEQLNLSPVTLSKRHDVNYLDTLYVYLFDKN
jgi:hypothetical protein